MIFNNETIFWSDTFLSFEYQTCLKFGSSLLYETENVFGFEFSDDEHCEEVERLKDYYCTSAHCKHFYSKHCYDIVNGVHPTCEVVRTCIEGITGNKLMRLIRHAKGSFGVFFNHLLGAAHSEHW